MAQSEQVRNRFDLDLALLRTNRAKQVVEAALRQAKHDLREAKVAEAEYRGSFRSFRDKLSGKKEASEAALRHAVQKAEADLAAARWELSAAEEKLSALEASLSRQPPWDTLRSPETDALWCRLEARYCIEVLIPMSEITLELLDERRKQFNGANAGELKTQLELASIYSAPEAAAEDCKPYILRLKAALDALGIPFETGSFFDGPAAFLSSATQFTRMDRVNAAIAHTAALQRTLPKLQKQLEG